MASNIRVPKICKHCGKEFIAKTTVTKYCCDNCAKRAYKKHKRDEKVQEVAPVAIQKAQHNQSRIKDKDFLSIAETCEQLLTEKRKDSSGNYGNLDIMFTDKVYGKR